MKTRRPRSSNSLAERLPSAKWRLLIRPPASASWLRPTPSARIVATAATLIEDFFMPSAFQKESPAPRDKLEVDKGRRPKQTPLTATYRVMLIFNSLAR